MGNLCGKEGSSPAPAGHVLGSAPATARQKTKNPKKPKVTGPGRTLGASGSGPGRDGASESTPPADARAAAAAAAEVWADKSLGNTSRLNRLLILPIATIKQCSEKWQVDYSARSRQAEDTESAHPGFGKNQGATGGIGLGLEFTLLMVHR